MVKAGILIWLHLQVLLDECSWVDFIALDKRMWWMDMYLGKYYCPVLALCEEC